MVVLLNHLPSISLFHSLYIPYPFFCNLWTKKCFGLTGWRRLNPKIHPLKKRSTRPYPTRIWTLGAQLNPTQPVFSSQKRVQPEKSGRVWPHYSDPKPSQWHFKHCVYLPDLYHAHPDIVFCCGTYGQKTTDNCPANYIFWKVRFLFFRLLTGVIFRMMFGQDKMKNK